MFVLAALAKGAHALRLRYVPAGAPDLTVILSGDVVAAALVGRH